MHSAKVVMTEYTFVFSQAEAEIMDAILRQIDIHDSDLPNEVGDLLYAFYGGLPVGSRRGDFKIKLSEES